MRKMLALMSCLTVSAVLIYSSPQEGYYSYSYGQLSYVRGDVFVQKAGDLGYEEGTVNLVVVEGDKLGTREGRAEIHFGKKNYLRIDNHTQIDLADLPREGDDRISLHLLSGKIYLRISRLGREKDFEIHTPDASFYILEEGLYRFEIKEERETVLYVMDGAVEAAGEEGSRLIEAEESLIVSDGYFSTGPDLFYAAYDDSFAEWNRSRDALHNRPVKVSYLPTEIYEYEAELAYYGNWVYEQPYGYVWVPRVHHYSWRPYYYGRWSWYPIIGWTWISHEPWGWCVSHYGRWHWRGGLGWYWIPTIRWGPAWVHWHCGYDYYGWCPLSYYNYPVVIVNNRFYGRGYGSHYPVHSRALTVIHKNQLRAPHISKVALSQRNTAKLGKISMTARQPGIQSGISRFRTRNSEAEKVLSRSGLRQVEKSYRAGKTVRLPGQTDKNSTGRSSQRSIRPSSPLRTPVAAGGREAKVGSSPSSRVVIDRSASSSVRGEIDKRVSPTVSRSYSSRSEIKRYPATGKSAAPDIRSEAGKQKESIYREQRGSVRTSSSRSQSSGTRIKDYASRGISYQREKLSTVTKRIEGHISSRTMNDQRRSAQSYSSRKPSHSLSYRSPLSTPSSSRSSRSQPSYSLQSRGTSNVRSPMPRISSSRSWVPSPKSSSSSRIQSSSPSRYSSSPSRVSRSSSSSSSRSHSSSSSSGKRVKK